MTSKNKFITKQLTKKTLIDLGLIAAFAVVIILAEIALAIIMSVIGFSQYSSLTLIIFFAIAFLALVYCEYKGILRDYKHIEHERIWGNHL